MRTILIVLAALSIATGACLHVPEYGAEWEPVEWYESGDDDDSAS